MSSGESRSRSSGRKRAESIVFDLMLLDGPPWGFSLSGGEEFGTNLIVSEIHLNTGRKLRLLRGDEIVAIDDIPVSSLSEANELLAHANGELLITVRRKYLPNHRSSYHERSSNRNSWSGETKQLRNPIEEQPALSKSIKVSTPTEEGTVMRRLSRTLTYQGMSPRNGSGQDSPLDSKGTGKDLQSPSREGSVTPQNDSVKKVTIKSINLPTNDGSTQELYSTHLSSKKIQQAKMSSLQPRPAPSSKKCETDLRFQSRSFSSLTSVGRNGNITNRYQHWKEMPKAESGVERTANMNVASAKAMFEEISKSQENLLNIGAPQRGRVERRSTVDHQRKNHALVSHSVSSLPSHSHSKSLPSDVVLSSSKPVTTRRTNNKSSNSFDEMEMSNPVTMATPSPPPRYSRSKILSSFREKRRSQPIEIFEQYRSSQSVEDLRQLHDPRRDNSEGIVTDKLATEMREAAKRYHQQVGQKHPGSYRFSVGNNEHHPDQYAKMLRSASISVVGTSAGPTANRERQPIASKPRSTNSGTNSLTQSLNLSSTGESFDEISESEVFISPGNKSETIDSESLMSRLMREQQQLSQSHAGLASVKAELSNQNGPSHGECTSIEHAPTKINDSALVTEPQSRGHEQAQAIGQNTIDLNTTTMECNEAVYHSKQASVDSMEELEHLRDGIPSDHHNNSWRHHTSDEDNNNSNAIEDLPPPPDDLLIDTPVVAEKKPTRTINRRKKDGHSGQSRSNSCVSTDSTMSTATSDSGIVLRSCLSTDCSPSTSPLTDFNSPYDSDDIKNDDDDEAFGGSREMLDDYTRDYIQNEHHHNDIDRPSVEQRPDFNMQQSISDTPHSSSPNSRRSSCYLSPKLEALDSEKSQLVRSMQDKIHELKEQEQEISDEITANESLGVRVTEMVQRYATQLEFSKYERFIGELNKIVVLLLSLTQRLHRYELMLQDLDMAEEEDKQKRDMLISKIEKLKSQHEEACNLRDFNDKRGENVALFLEKYCNEEEFADFQYFIDMKSQLALMQSEIKEKVKLGEERLQALESAGIDWEEVESETC